MADASCSLSGLSGDIPYGTFNHEDFSHYVLGCGRNAFATLKYGFSLPTGRLYRPNLAQWRWIVALCPISYRQRLTNFIARSAYSVHHPSIPIALFRAMAEGKTGFSLRREGPVFRCTTVRQSLGDVSCEVTIARTDCFYQANQLIFQKQQTHAG